MNAPDSRKKRIHGASVATAAAVVLCAGTLALAQSNIDPDAAFAWGENVGWINLRPSNEFGVVVEQTYLSGWAWGENIGYVWFGDGPANGLSYTNDGTDHGVNVDPDDGLSGYAWGENVGWIVFDTTSVGASQVTIDRSTGEFGGYAYGENIGWINFDQPNGVRFLPESSVDTWSELTW